MSRKIGRPKIANPRNRRLNLRLRENESILIQQCAWLLGKSRTDTIMSGINMVKAELDKKQL